MVAEEIARRFQYTIHQSKFARKEDLNFKIKDNVRHAIEILELDDETLKTIYLDSYGILGKGLRLQVP